MARALTIRVRVERLPFSPASLAALRHLGRYDLIVFTSKNAKKFFAEVLRERGIPVPRECMLSVGPRADLLKLAIDHKRILFPRSAIAPHDIVRRMRARAASVRVLPLYTARAVPLSGAQKKALLGGKVTALHFRSPSGVSSLMAQVRGQARKEVLAIPAHCIGPTTAVSARQAGFKKVFSKGV